MITAIILYLLFSIIDDLFAPSHTETHYVERKSDKPSPKGRSVTRIRETKPDGTVVEGESRWTAGHSKEDYAFLGLN